jgi:hypothetical protein
MQAHRASSLCARSVAASTVVGLLLCTGAALADPPAAGGTAATTEDANGQARANEQHPATTDAATIDAAPDALPRLTDPVRPRTVVDWTKVLTNRLSLREFIHTMPVVVGGVTVYLEAEAVAAHQRPTSTSQLTLALAPDRLVVLGAF